jgi:hypothetical protein
MTGTDIWTIQVTFCDEESNAFVTLGSIYWATETEWEAAWNSIPGAPLGWEGEDRLCVDKLDNNGDHLAEWPVTSDVVEILLGKTIDQLIKEGREKP